MTINNACDLGKSLFIKGKLLKIKAKTLLGWAFHRDNLTGPQAYLSPYALALCPCP